MSSLEEQWAPDDPAFRVYLGGMAAGVASFLATRGVPGEIAEGEGGRMMREAYTAAQADPAVRASIQFSIDAMRTGQRPEGAAPGTFTRIQVTRPAS